MRWTKNKFIKRRRQGHKTKGGKRERNVQRSSRVGVPGKKKKKKTSNDNGEEGSDQR